MSLQIHPLAPERWDDFAALMGAKGGAAGCWCMLWRLPAAAWRERSGAPNRTAMQERVATGPRPPGLIAYADGTAAGWVSVAPRAEFPRLTGSRVLAPVDGAPVWSVTCFSIEPASRGKGVATALLAAVSFAARHGARVLEGYPVDPGAGRYADTFAWTGLKPLFDAAGLTEAARRSPTRPIMRKEVSNG